MLEAGIESVCSPSREPNAEPAADTVGPPSDTRRLAGGIHPTQQLHVLAALLRSLRAQARALKASLATSETEKLGLVRAAQAAASEHAAQLAMALAGTRAFQTAAAARQNTIHELQRSLEECKRESKRASAALASRDAEVAEWTRSMSPRLAATACALATASSRQGSASALVQAVSAQLTELEARWACQAEATRGLEAQLATTQAALQASEVRRLAAEQQVAMLACELQAAKAEAAAGSLPARARRPRGARAGAAADCSSSCVSAEWPSSPSTASHASQSRDAADWEGGKTSAPHAASRPSGRQHQRSPAEDTTQRRQQRAQHLPARSGRRLLDSTDSSSAGETGDVRGEEYHHARTAETVARSGGGGASPAASGSGLGSLPTTSRQSSGASPHASRVREPALALRRAHDAQASLIIGRRPRASLAGSMPGSSARSPPSPGTADDGQASRRRRPRRQVPPLDLSGGEDARGPEWPLPTPPPRTATDGAPTPSATSPGSMASSVGPRSSASVVDMLSELAAAVAALEVQLAPSGPLQGTAGALSCAVARV
uniref:Uncharacterized protein n=1 Tax=Auxenochlorella protothecoides TaxID=3075 RepID=A0A1D2A0U0_AUXPR